MAVAAVAVYHNSFRGVFVFDDQNWIVDNPTIRQLWPIRSWLFPPPALVVGVPVGFVNAAESKDALARQDCPYITALGPKGGSALAASIINALAIMALKEMPS